MPVEAVAHVLGAHVVCAVDVLRSHGMSSRGLTAESAPLMRLGEMRRLGPSPAFECLLGYHLLAGILGNGQTCSYFPLDNFQI
jgi:hypothetical protein